MSWDVAFLHGTGAPPEASDTPEDWPATPWGPRAELRAVLSAALEGIDWSDPDWGICEGAGFTVEADLGADEPVTGFMLHLRGGGEAALDGLKRVQALPGWYGFDLSSEDWLHLGADVRASWAAFQRSRDAYFAAPGRDDGPRPGFFGRVRGWFRR